MMILGFPRSRPDLRDRLPIGLTTSPLATRRESLATGQRSYARGNWVTMGLRALS
jgi:hypothetical protein